MRMLPDMFLCYAQWAGHTRDETLSTVTVNLGCVLNPSHAQLYRRPQVTTRWCTKEDKMNKRWCPQITCTSEPRTLVCLIHNAVSLRLLTSLLWRIYTAEQFEQFRPCSKNIKIQSFQLAKKSFPPDIRLIWTAVGLLFHKHKWTPHLISIGPTNTSSSYCLEDFLCDFLQQQFCWYF